MGNIGTMANSNFVVHNGLTVGPTTIDAASGNVSIPVGKMITIGNIILRDNGNGQLAVRDITDNSDAIVNATLDSGTQTLGNIQIGANHIESMDSNGQIALRPNGTGNIALSSNTIDVGRGGVTTISTGGAFTGANLTLAPGGAGFVVVTGNLQVSGNFVVNGTTTNINSTNLVIEDKNIVLADVATPDNTTADGGGITLKGSSDKTLNWVNSTSAWTSSEDFNLLTGKVYKINGTSVLSGSTLGSGVTASSLTSVGTLTGGALGTGFTTVGTAQGGTGLTSFTLNGAVYASSTSVLTTGTLPVASGGTGITSFGTGVATFLGTPSSANLLAAVTDETGTGALVFATSPTFTTQITTPVIVHSGTNGVGDIGGVGATFATVYATTFSGVSTTAKYADLAENYSADAAYEPGTVVQFGGEFEVTACDTDGCTRVAGVVSTAPAHLMNTGLTGDNVVAVALNGRVPCQVQGTVQKGDLMVSAGNGRARAEANPRVGSVIGKALENFDGPEGVIEVVVGIR